LKEGPVKGFGEEERGAFHSWVEGKDSCAAKMGASVSWLSGLLWSKKEIRILILGLVFHHLPPLLSSCFTNAMAK